MAINFFKIFKGLSLKGQSADPTVNVESGDVYYNSTLNKFRGYQGSSWVDLAGGGAGQGVINYIENPNFENDADGWVDSGGGMTVTRTVTLADLPRENSTGTGGLFVASSATAGDYVEYDFNMDRVDTPKRLVISFDVKPQTGGSYPYAADDFEVVMYDKDNSAEIIIENPEIKAATYSFKQTFLASGANDYGLRIKTTVANSDGVVLSNIKVTAEDELVQGMPSTDWEDVSSDYSFQGVTTSEQTVYSKRLGDTLYVRGSFRNTARDGNFFSVILPSGITVDTSKISTQTHREHVGRLFRLNNGVSETYVYKDATNQRANAIFFDGTNTDRLFITETQGSSAREFSKVAGNSVINSTGYAFSFDFAIPVAEWAGSSVGLANSRVEYAYNTSTSTAANDTTSFAYGPSGAVIQQITAALTRRARFLTPIQPTDKITVEVSLDRKVWLEVPWTTDTLIERYRYDGSNFIGLGYGHVSGSTTDIDVSFGRYRSGTSTAWGATAGAGYWRVAKSSNPLSIGMPQVYKWQTKYLQANANNTGIISGAGGDDANFKFSNLTVGQTYELTSVFKVYTPTKGGDAVLKIYNHSNGSSNQIGIIEMQEGGDGDSIYSTMSNTVIFTALTSDVVFNITALDGSGYFTGTGTFNNSWATLKELPYHSETTEW